MSRSATRSAKITTEEVANFVNNHESSPPSENLPRAQEENKILDNVKISELSPQQLQEIDPKHLQKLENDQFYVASVPQGMFYFTSSILHDPEYLDVADAVHKNFLNSRILGKVANGGALATSLCNANDLI